jgi:hypothetical protein
MLAERRIEKHYRALVEGRMKETAGRIELPIDRSRKDRKKRLRRIMTVGRQSSPENGAARRAQKLLRQSLKKRRLMPRQVRQLLRQSWNSRPIPAAGARLTSSPSSKALRSTLRRKPASTW